MNRLIEWFVDNPIAANLLMGVILIGGAFKIANLNKEVFPGVDTNSIQITVPYPGAGPREVEELVVQRLEEAVADLDGIKEITSTARMGSGTVVIEAISGFDSQELLNEVKAQVDAISTLPGDSERPRVTEVKWRSDVMSIALFGAVDQATLKRTGERVRSELAQLPSISIAELDGTRNDEMAIEISEQAMRHYNLSFEQIVQAVRGSSLNLPAGTINSVRGSIQLQTRGQAYTAEDFEKIVVQSKADGAKLHLGDVATVTDGFEDFDMIASLNGKPAVFVELYVTENPDVLNAASEVNAYLEDARQHLPAGIELTVWRDWSVVFKGRMDLLLKNSLSGLLLVFAVLMLFLRPALASWVCVGIVVAFMGTFWFLPMTGVSLHMISLFAFLLVLGIVVDDAIIVGESIYTHQQQGMTGNAAAAAGAKSVSKPVLFAVISTMIFFTPILAIPGPFGDMSYSIPVVVILSLFFSLVESLLILPAHLSNLKPEAPRSRFALFRQLERWRERLSAGMLHFSDRVYQPTLKKLLAHNGATVAVFMVAFALSVALYSGGWMKRSFMPSVPSDYVHLSVTLPEGVPFSDTKAVLNKAEAAIAKVEVDPALREANGNQSFIANRQAWAYRNRVHVILGMTSPELREISVEEVRRRWYEELGPLPEVEEFAIHATINSRDKAISMRLSLGGSDDAKMTAALEDVKAKLALYPGVFEVKDSLTAARTEIELDLKDHAETLGLTLQNIARQVRQGFYGEEAQRIPRGHEDVRVMVRYPKEERESIDLLGEMRIRGADNREIPLEAVADIEFVPGYTAIKRIDRKRSIRITAEVKPGTSEAGQVVMDLLRRNEAEWRREYPGFQLGLSGDMKEQAAFMASAGSNFLLAFLAIYGLMAVAFRSYWQPFLILTAVPFGFMGAVIGHLLMGVEISMMSMLGFFACAGVVVNDNLVLLDRINQMRAQGMEFVAAVVQAGRDRFRPIILTSLTTFIGLVPIMAETSTQARFLIPMVISLAFGVLFATTVTLILVPQLYVLGERAKARLHRRKERAGVQTSS